MTLSTLSIIAHGDGSGFATGADTQVYVNGHRLTNVRDVEFKTNGRQGHVEVRLVLAVQRVDITTVPKIKVETADGHELTTDETRLLLEEMLEKLAGGSG